MSNENNSGENVQRENKSSAPAPEPSSISSRIEEIDRLIKRENRKQEAFKRGAVVTMDYVDTGKLNFEKSILERVRNSYA